MFALLLQIFTVFTVFPHTLQIFPMFPIFYSIYIFLFFYSIPIYLQFSLILPSFTLFPYIRNSFLFCHIFTIPYDFTISSYSLQFYHKAIRYNHFIVAATIISLYLYYTEYFRILNSFNPLKHKGFAIYMPKKFV